MKIKKKTITNVNKETKVVDKVRSYIKKNWTSMLSCVAMLSVMCLGTATASADGMWNTMVDVISTWVSRLGLMVLFVGGIQFALGWKREDADGKTQGVQTMIAGGIVLALAGVAGSYLGGSGATP